MLPMLRNFSDCITFTIAALSTTSAMVGRVCLVIRVGTTPPPLPGEGTMTLSLDCMTVHDSCAGTRLCNSCRAPLIADRRQTPHSAVPHTRGPALA